METYFVVGRQVGRPPGFQRQPSQYSTLAAVVYAMAQARRKQCNTSSSSCRPKSQQRDSSGKKIFPNYSSMRISHRTPANPVRRNTTRTHRNNLHARSQPNMRQLGSGSNLENPKFFKSIDRDTPGMQRMTISQSAPHTPLCACHCDGQMIKSVPRLLSEPTVSHTTNSSPIIKHYSSKSNNNSPYLQDKQEGFLHDVGDGGRVFKSAGVLVPVHSPNRSLSKKDSKFFLKSPLVKRDTKNKIDSINSISLKPNGTDLSSNLSSV
ncbi:hypothetical protein FQR65_LT12474 [Abscondita terminalis]|nr:hypothetical protein FQR65_LT12474 [Abscondita terminalis]